MPTTLINIVDLPIDIVSKLPISIQLEKIFNLEDLELTDRLLIETVIQSSPIIIDTQPTNILDGKFDYGTKNDVVHITTESELVLEILQNYFQIPYSSYPYDPSYGHELKPHLTTRDTSLRQELISNEITNITQTISRELEIPTSLIGISIKNVNTVKYTDVVINLELEIGDDITITKERQVLTVSDRIANR